jgi:outer membrane cobalamin receptor
MDRGKRVAVIGALWVAADAEPAAGPVELETVTVTATKTEHPAFEVAGSVSMVAAETIEAEQPQSPDDILKALPNIERRTYTIGYRYDDPKNPWARIETTAYRFDKRSP